MRLWRYELYRILIVVALGGGLAQNVASVPDRPKVAAPRPAPVILAAAMDADPPAQCLLPPRDKGDERPWRKKQRRQVRTPQPEKGHCLRDRRPGRNHGQACPLALARCPLRPAPGGAIFVGARRRTILAARPDRQDEGASGMRSVNIPRKSLLVGATLMGVAAAVAEAGASQETNLRLPGVLFNRLVAENVGIRRGLAFGPGSRQKLDVYRPAPEMDRKAIVIFYYGGGWRRGERSMYRFVGAALAAQGFTTVIPDYRLYPEFGFPEFMEDAALTYAWVQSRLNSGGLRRPVILMGHSAGGHIAALLALDPRYLADCPAPAAVVGLAGPYAFDPTTWPRTSDIFRAAANDPGSARPVAFVSADAPPMFLSRGAEDKVVAAFNADDLAEGLRAKGVYVENRLYAGMGHAGLVLALARPFRWRAPVLSESVAFIDHVLKQRVTALR